jgi:hypothetical protein
MSIFLIDEKKERQEKYGWTEERLSHYKDLVCIRDFETLKTLGSDRICQRGNIVFFHDSFFRNLSIEERHQQTFEQKLREKTKYVKFGGSFGATYISEDGQMAVLPVSHFYSHLESFLQSEGKDYPLLTLAYGESYEQEKWLQLKNNFWNRLFSYPANKSLSEKEREKILEAMDYDPTIEAILDQNHTIIAIKNTLNQWKTYSSILKDTSI